MFFAIRLIRFLLVMLGITSVAACQQPEVGHTAAESEVLTAIGGMSQARAAHTATTLSDGQVLLAGGFGSVSVAGAELFDPVSEGFTSAARMATPRYSHTATPLADGRVLLAGGYDARGRYLSSAELYDPVNGSFAPAGTLNNARADHVAVPLQDGRVLLIGGVGLGWTFLASAELYDPATNTFTVTGEMTVPRESHTAVRLNDGRVLVTGGHRGRRADLQLFASAELYDPTTGVFTSAGDMTLRRHKHDAVLLPDGRVLITGGADERDSNGIYRSVELYDPATATFTSGGMMRLARYKHRGTSIVLPNGLVLLAGGATQAETYNPRKGIFTLVNGRARMAGQFSASTLLLNGEALITGGYGENRGPQQGAWLYCP